jgi:carboxyl-terminal processing protease
MSGSFEGIGAEVGIREGVLTVISPLEGNPAEKAGLKPKDKILEINGTSTADLTLDEAVNLIRGKKGTEVNLLIGRKSWEKPQEVGVTRGNIEIPIIEWSIKENNIAYIEFYNFTENSPEEFRKIVNDVLERNPRGIVLDLRNNPGGYLNASIEIASWFLPAGEVVVMEDFGESEKKKYRSKGYGLLEEIPTAVLINEGSASASEILAGAVKPKDNVTVIGEQSFGKGSVQQLEDLKDGSSLKISIAKWLTPTGKNINEEGIEPEIKIERTSKDVEKMEDPQLDKAIEVLKQ